MRTMVVIVVPHNYDQAVSVLKMQSHLVQSIDCACIYALPYSKKKIAHTSQCEWPTHALGAYTHELLTVLLESIREARTVACSRRGAYRVALHRSISYKWTHVSVHRFAAVCICMRARTHRFDHTERRERQRRKKKRENEREYRYFNDPDPYASHVKMKVHALASAARQCLADFLARSHRAFFFFVLPPSSPLLFFFLLYALSDILDNKHFSVPGVDLRPIFNHYCDWLRHIRRLYSFSFYRLSTVAQSLLISHWPNSHFFQPV